jgi:hypothetical protein
MTSTREELMALEKISLFNEFGEDTQAGIARKALAALRAQPVAQPAEAIELTNDDVRAVGGIVHRDGSVFFTNVALLNKAITHAKDKP